MRLTFSILWFDDREDYFDSLDLDYLKSEIEGWGFAPNIIQVLTPEKFVAYSPYERIDLIVVDRNLEGYEDGQEFIDRLRKSEVYTEVVFYTSGEVGDLWDSIFDKKLEGVFVSGRKEVESKIVQVGKQAIRKVLDLENMRGIIMAEVGELDQKLDDILMAGLPILSEDKLNSIYKRFHEGAKGQNSQQASTLASFIAAPTPEGLVGLCDSDKRWCNLRRLAKDHPSLNLAELGDYQADVLAPRNFLAHGKPIEMDAGGYKFRFRNNTYLFNDEVSRLLRQTMLKYKKQFSVIFEQLDSC